MRTLEHHEVLSFLRGVLHALHVVRSGAAPAVHSGHVVDLASSFPVPREVTLSCEVLHALHVVQQVVQQPECAMAEAPG
jgi:hypothetical protein